MFSKPRLYPLLAALLIAAPAAALADPVYSINFLPDGFQGLGLAENGVVTGSTDSGGAIYANGNLTQYGNLGISQITAINSSGAFTGSMRGPGATESHAFVFENGGIHDLGRIDGQDTMGAAINESGQVAGRYMDFTGAAGVFLYSQGAMTRLASQSRWTWPGGINDAGVVVGADRNQAFMYSNGVLTHLPSLGGISSWASDINNSGDIVGSVELATYHAFLYSNGVMHDLGTFGGSASVAFANNDSGLVVGDFFSSERGSTAFLYDNGSSWDLNTLVSGTGNWRITNAREINDAGQILGSACDAATCRDVVLNPVSAVPEPGTYAMLLVGLATIAGRRRTGQRQQDV